MPATRGKSVENHTLLVQLSDSVNNLATTLKTHVIEQQEENKRLHSRIDDTQNQSRKGVDEIKDSLAARGKLSPTILIATVAMIVSLLTAIGGFTHSYVSGRLENIIPLIDANAAETTLVRDWIRDDIKADLAEFRQLKSKQTK